MAEQLRDGRKVILAVVKSLIDPKGIDIIFASDEEVPFEFQKQLADMLHDAATIRNADKMRAQIKAQSDIIVPPNRRPL